MDKTLLRVILAQVAARKGRAFAEPEEKLPRYLRHRNSELHSPERRLADERRPLLV